MKVTILGCGPSNGVPTVLGEWGTCDPNNPKNRRRRPSIFIETDDSKILVDTSPDFREQALSAAITEIDAVLYTHEHADHIMGIDDLRSICRNMGHQIDAYGAPHVIDLLTRKFGYLFDGTQESVGNLYRPIYLPHQIAEPFMVGHSQIIPLDQDHGICRSLGFRICNFAYSTDVVAMPQESLDQLHGLDCWVVDCLRASDEHPTHAHLDVTMRWIKEIKPKRVILTHMNFQTDYDEMAAILPDGIEPGYDGMVLEL